MIGRIYHIIDNTTKEVIKVGSTIRTLHQRFREKDYKRKYTNHSIHEARIIESSDIDVYDKNDSKCPFLWHLVAAEHLEIFKMGTFRNGHLSNKFSPLAQKHRGLDQEFSVLGGQTDVSMLVLNWHLISI